jgi:predicted nucleotidyltransferase
MLIGGLPDAVRQSHFDGCCDIIRALYGELMPSRAIDDPILKRFLVALNVIYGDRLERVVLFGSRARGDANKDSDYDIAVFVKDLGLLSSEFGRLADVETDILYDTGAVVNALPFAAGAYQERTGFMHELRRDGLDL